MDSWTEQSVMLLLWCCTSENDHRNFIIFRALQCATIDAIRRCVCCFLFSAKLLNSYILYRLVFAYVHNISITS